MRRTGPGCADLVEPSHGVCVFIPSQRRAGLFVSCSALLRPVGAFSPITNMDANVRTVVVWIRIQKRPLHSRPDLYTCFSLTQGYRWLLQSKRRLQSSTRDRADTCVSLECEK